MVDVAPEPLADHHVLGEFNCGIDDLNTWLKQRARKNERKYSRTFVVCDDNERVFGFYCLIAGVVGRSELIRSMRRNAPERVPAMILGRLAVDVACQNQGLGSLLLKDAFRRSLHVAQTAGVRMMLLHAKSESLQEYYSRFGFRPLPEHPLTMVVPMEFIAGSLESD